MAGAMRKMAVYLGLVEDDPNRYDDYDDYIDDDQQQQERRPVPVQSSSGSHAYQPEQVSRSQHQVHGQSAPVVPSSDDYRITTLHPRSYNDARAIGEHFREGSPVIMNLTDMDDADAKRLVDFGAGLVFGLRGTIEKITAKVFLLSPANVVVTAEERARMAQGGFFNQS